MKQTRVLFRKLPMDIKCRILEALPPNDCALTCRLVNKEFFKRLDQPRHRTARFSLPMPPHATFAAWQPHLQQALKQLTFCNKLDMLSAAASSGSDVNLEVAWGLLRPALAQGLSGAGTGVPDACTSAVRSGHLHLLPWLLHHDVPLDVQSTLEAAARHCDLAGLQRVWALLANSPNSRGRDAGKIYHCELQSEAALSHRDVIPKLSWLMVKAGKDTAQQGQQSLLCAAAVGAAAAGSLPVLRWLRAAGMDLGGALRNGSVPVYSVVDVFAQALQHGHVAAADWLVDEAGAPLPQQEQRGEQETLWEEAGRGGSVAALQWLQRRGVAGDMEQAVEFAAWGGHLQAVQFLHEQCGAELTASVFRAAAGSSSIPTAQWLLQAGCAMGPEAYRSAASMADGGMIRWLVGHAGCPWQRESIADVISVWPYDETGRPDLEASVRLLVEAGCPYGLDSGSMDAAAACGRLPLLRYLHEDLGVGFGPGTMAVAARDGCEEVLEWLVGAGCRAGGGLGSDPYVAAAANGDMATLRCLRRLGVTWGEWVLRAAVDMGAPPPVVRWLVEQGAPWDGEAVEKAEVKARGEERWRECAEWLAAARKEVAEPLAVFRVPRMVREQGGCGNGAAHGRHRGQLGLVVGCGGAIVGAIAFAWRLWRGQATPLSTGHAGTAMTLGKCKGRVTDRGSG